MENNPFDFGPVSTWTLQDCAIKKPNTAMTQCRTYPNKAYSVFGIAKKCIKDSSVAALQSFVRLIYTPSCIKSCFSWQKCEGYINLPMPLKKNEGALVQKEEDCKQKGDQGRKEEYERTVPFLRSINRQSQSKFYEVYQIQGRLCE